MIHYSDIHDALARGDVPEIEDAFRAFVGFPNEDDMEGPGAMLDDFVETFERVCRALRNDKRTMPSATSAALWEVARGFDEELADHTYASGAKMALGHVPHFRAHFRKYFDDEYINELAHVVPLHPVGEA